MAARLVGEVPDGGGRLRFAHMLVRDARLRGAARDAAAAPAPRGRRGARGACTPGTSSPTSPSWPTTTCWPGAAGAEQAIGYAGGARATARPRSSPTRRRRATTRPRSTCSSPSRSGDQRETCELLLALGDVLHRAGKGPEAKAALRRAADIAERNGWAEQLARAALGYGGRFAWARASTDPALVPLLERALAAVGDEDSPARARLLGPARRPRRGTTSPRAPGRGSARRRSRSRSASAIPATLATRSRATGWRSRARTTAEELLGIGERLIALAEQIGDRELVFAARDHRLNVLWSLATATPSTSSSRAREPRRRAAPARPALERAAPNGPCSRSWRAASTRRSG